MPKKERDLEVAGQLTINAESTAIRTDVAPVGTIHGYTNGGNNYIGMYTATNGWQYVQLT